jgi:hypothetical protein
MAPKFCSAAARECLGSSQGMPRQLSGNASAALSEQNLGTSITHAQRRKIWRRRGRGNLERRRKHVRGSVCYVSEQNLGTSITHAIPASCGQRQSMALGCLVSALCLVPCPSWCPCKQQAASAAAPPCRRTTGAYNAHNAKRGPATARYLEVCAPGQSWGGSGSSFPSPRAGLPCPGPGRSVATWSRGPWTPWCCTEAFWHYYTLLGGACCMRKPRKQLFSGIALRGFALVCMGITTAPFLFFRRALQNCRFCTAPFASRKAMSVRTIHGKGSGPNRPPRTDLGTCLATRAPQTPQPGPKAL